MANSTIKAVTLTSSGLISRARCRMRGLYFVAQTAGTISFLDGGSGGAGGLTTVQIGVPGGSACAIDVRIPDNGVLFAASAFAQIGGTSSSMTIFIEVA